MSRSQQIRKALATFVCQSNPSCSTSVPNTGRGGVASACHSQAWLAPRYAGHAVGCMGAFKRDIRTTAAAKDARLLYIAPEIAPGLLVEYKRDQKSGLALLQHPDGAKNWKAIDARGHVYSLRPSQMSYILPGRDFTQEDLETVLSESSRHVSDGNDALMMAAWEIVSDERDELFTVTEMADLLFNQTDSASCYAAHRLLSEDRRYFKQAGRNPPLFAPRSPTEVMRFKEQAAAEQRAAEEMANLQKELWKACLLDYGQKPTRQQWLGGPWKDVLLALQDHALTGDMATAEPSRLVRDAMAPLMKGNVTPQAACELLKRLGFWHPQEQVGLLQAGLTEEYPPAVEAAARDLLGGPPVDLDAALRQDVRHFPSWAIDSAETREVDDAVGLETLANGRQRVWIHVADPTCRLREDSALAAEASRRTSTLYIPTGSLPMFPRDLAEGLFSLSSERGSAALSVCVTLDSQGAIEDCDVVNTIVQPLRVTYSDLDEQVESTQHFSSPELRALGEVAQLRRDWRAKQGAIFMEFPEYELHVRAAQSQAPEVELEMIEQTKSPSRQLVSELMILANEAFATVGERNGISLPYRGQAEVVKPKPEELAAIPEGICQDTFMRGRMTRSVLTTSKPLSHATLGLQRYVQATSPIRRYTDLLAHWQIKAHLRGEAPPMDVQKLGETVDDLQGRSRDVFVLVREANKYWLTYFFHHLRQENPDRIYKALLTGWIRQDTGFAHVLIPEFGLEIASRIQRPAKIGEKLRLECTLADLATSELVFCETKEDDTEEELLSLQMSASDSSLESSVTALGDRAGPK